MAGIKLTGDWVQAQAILNALPKDLDNAIQSAIEGEAQVLRSAIVRHLGKVKPGLSPFTGMTGKRKGSKPLIDTGEMRNSIGVVMGHHEAFIGIPRSSGGYRLADIHEKGRVIVQRMTDKQRRFLHATIGRKASKVGSGTGVLVIHIPARPFVAPAFAEQRPKIPARLMARIVAALGTKLGAPPSGASAAAGGAAAKARDRSAAAKKGWATRRAGTPASLKK